MKWTQVMYMVMLTISFVLLYYAYEQFKITQGLIRNGLVTTGKVVRLEVVSGDDGNTYRPVFEYVNQQTRESVIFSSTSSSNPAPYKVGDVVKVIYLENSERHRVVSYFELYGSTIMLLASGLPFLVVGGGFLLYLVYANMLGVNSVDVSLL